MNQDKTTQLDLLVCAEIQQNIKLSLKTENSRNTKVFKPHVLSDTPYCIKSKTK